MALGAELGLDLKQEGNRFTAREQISALIAPWCAERTLAQIHEAFTEHRVTWAPYRTVREALRDDPDCSTDNPMFTELSQPGVGTVLAAASPLAFADLPRTVAAPAPRLGEHTDEVLLTVAGVSEAELGRLHDAGVVAGPKR